MGPAKAAATIENWDIDDDAAYVPGWEFSIQNVLDSDVCLLEIRCQRRARAIRPGGLFILPWEFVPVRNYRSRAVHAAPTIGGEILLCLRLRGWAGTGKNHRLSDVCEAECRGYRGACEEKPWVKPLDRAGVGFTIRA